MIVCDICRDPKKCVPSRCDNMRIPADVKIDSWEGRFLKLLIEVRPVVMSENGARLSAEDAVDICDDCLKRLALDAIKSAAEKPADGGQDDKDKKR